MAITDRFPLTIKPSKGSAPRLPQEEFKRHLGSERTQQTLAAAREKWNAWYGQDRTDHRTH